MSEGCKELRHWTLTYLGVRPVVINAERRGNRWQRAKESAVWREAFWKMAIAQRIPTLKAITVDVYPHYKNRKSLPDCATGAVFPSLKSALDGIVDAGVIPNDTDKYVRSTTFHPAVIDGWMGLEVVIRDVTCQASPT